MELEFIGINIYLSTNNLYETGSRLCMMHPCTAHEPSVDMLCISLPFLLFFRRHILYADCKFTIDYYTIFAIKYIVENKLYLRIGRHTVEFSVETSTCVCASVCEANAGRGIECD